MAKSKTSSIDSLKKDFDKVLLKHDVENRRTVAVLVKGNNIHVGVAKIHQDDTLNRPKGRLISLGRAIHANLVYKGERELRDTEQKRDMPLAFTVETDSKENTEKAITDLFNGNFFL
jgi:hypothetical protein